MFVFFLSCENLVMILFCNFRRGSVISAVFVCANPSSDSDSVRSRSRRVSLFEAEVVVKRSLILIFLALVNDQVSFVQYSDDAKTEFKLNAYRDKGVALSSLHYIPYRGGNTKTGLITRLKSDTSSLLFLHLVNFHVTAL